jgi:acyl-CoA thioesterase FadM
VQQLRVVLEDDVVVLLQELGTQRLVLGQEILDGDGRRQAKINTPNMNVKKNKNQS